MRGWCCGGRTFSQRTLIAPRENALTLRLREMTGLPRTACRLPASVLDCMSAVCCVTKCGYLSTCKLESSLCEYRSKHTVHSGPQ